MVFTKPSDLARGFSLVAAQNTVA